MRAALIQGFGVKRGFHQDVTRTELLAAAVRDPQEVVSKVRFEHRAVVADFSFIHGPFKFRHELAAHLL